MDSSGRHVWRSRRSSVFELGDVLALWGQAEVQSQGSLSSAWQGLQSRGGTKRDPCGAWQDGHASGSAGGGLGGLVCSLHFR